MTDAYRQQVTESNERYAREALSAVTMDGVREYAEQIPVSIMLREPDPHMPEYGPPTSEGPRLVIAARNEGGHNGTAVDLLDLIAWLRANRPELLGLV